MADLVGIIIRLLLLPVGFVFGGRAERRHWRALDAADHELAGIVCNNLKRVTAPEEIEQATLVLGQVVIATDYWKSFVTRLRNLVGGEMKSAESLMNRGRREALVRLKREAQRVGATEVWNVRYGFSNINQMQQANNSSGVMQVEVYAWGTAIRRKQVTG